MKSKDDSVNIDYDLVSHGFELLNNPTVMFCLGEKHIPQVQQ